MHFQCHEIWHQWDLVETVFTYQLRVWTMKEVSFSPLLGEDWSGQWTWLPHFLLALILESLVQTEKGQSCRGRELCGQNQWSSGCPGVPTGTSGSDPHLERCEGNVQRTAASGMQSSISTGRTLSKKSAIPLVPESRRHLRQWEVHGRPGSPLTGRHQLQQQERFRMKLESGDVLGWQVEQRCLPGLGL